MAELEPVRRTVLKQPTTDPRTRTVFTSETYHPDAVDADRAEIPIQVPSSENPDMDARATPPSQKERPRS
jgi:hypothetical protein